MLKGYKLVLSFLRMSKGPIQGQVKFAGSARGPYDVRKARLSCLCVRGECSPPNCRSERVPIGQAEYFCNQFEALAESDFHTFGGERGANICAIALASR